ncbi:uncharacterized protein BXZ73DRAFT_86240 [Epithele typhae]|uniref:uncharacterized protein n=1 Tax=Epithele typhae TaxID=378194 RepID=UPI0020081FD0|nr:uncharacterized protein BXZ73DRAFT_86240 [Epithele typhae]KAH9946036.1 hypothetical protein BXZ73DRAFT_86240 [Epithele typhae]
MSTPTLRVDTASASPARNESRKLLAHILSQLQIRPVPPSYLSTLATGQPQNEKGGGSMFKSVKGAVKYTGQLRGRRTHQPVPQEDDDSEDELADGFYTDTTVDLMNQLKDVLMLSIAHNWDIFYDSNTQTQRSNSDRLKDAFRRRRSLSVGRNSRSRSPSADPGDSEAVRAPELLSQCISILASIIAEDCRYKISSPRPSLPPNALQFISLDVARFLLYTHRHDPRVVMQIGFALLPAFLTFGLEMQTRLLAFIDEGIVGTLLADLRNLQGTRQLTSPPADGAYNDPSNDPPMVSILVDEVKEERVSTPTGPSWRRWTQALSPEDVALRSTSAPLQDIAIYHLSSVIPTVLAAILEGIDLASANSSVLHRFHRLFSSIAESKPDAYLDVLAVIAYHTPRSRYTAISLLLSYWPQSIGHLTVSKPFPTISYQDAIARETQGVTIARRQNTHPYAHQFVPWRFARPVGPNIFAGISQHDCHCCSNVIEGFGLLCSLCLCMVHFDCYDYPDGSFFTQYSVAADPSLQKVAVHRFSHILAHRHSHGAEVVLKENHAFRPVNLFSLTLCFICKKPLWGSIAQAMKCGACKQFVHSSCLTWASSGELVRCRSATIDDTYMTISWRELRQSFADHYREIFLTEADLPLRTFEELSVILSVLWIQQQILNNGLALGSMVVQQDNPSFDEGKLDEFELHYLVDLLEAYLRSRTPAVSPALSDHFIENNIRASEPEAHIFFNWNVLAFVTSIVKTPPTTLDPMPSGDFLLTPNGPQDRDGSLEDSSYPFEVATLAHLRDQLGDQLDLRSEATAKYLLTHLFHLGFFQRVDSHGRLFDGSPHPERLLCSFPIPMGLEVSTEVETLVSAIEACLQDINLSVNETGLLLLVRRFWPDGMLTEYALRRLTKTVLAWVLSEDDDLATMLRDYVARGLSLPGVRSGAGEQPWPQSTQSRPAGAGSANNGGDYIAGRRSLSTRYAARWLLALHDQDINNYSVIVFDLLVEQANELPVGDDFFLGKGYGGDQRKEAIITEKILLLILKLSQASVLFTSFDDLFQKWLERASSLDVDKQQPLASLSRLFNRELDTASQRFSASVIEPRLSMSETPSMLTTNPLKIIVDIANKSYEGYDMTLHWLCLFVRSGVEISGQTFMQLVNLGNKFGVSLEVCTLLIKAALWSTWLKSMGRQDLQTVIAAIHTGIGPQLVQYLQAYHRVEDVLQVIRQSLATCLLLYGCDRTYLQTCGMILEDEVKGLPSRRKLHARNQSVTDPIIVNSLIIDALRTYVETGLQEVSCVAAKFLDAFMHHATLVESYEVDNFVLRNGSSLSTCIWQFYGVQASQISTIRTSLLLRVLVVDPQPMQLLLQDTFEFKGNWEARLQAVVKLFRIVEDVTSPAFNVEDRQWRSSVNSIFYYFFRALWEDDHEEIRLSCSGAHFEAITLCWNETLTKSPVAERRKLVSFLNQLRPHFPHWPLLSWQVLLEALLEAEFNQRNGDDEEGPMSAHLSMYGLPPDSRKTMLIDPDLLSLQNSLISLALRMVADGILIDVVSMLKLKDHLAKTIGYAEVAMLSTGQAGSIYVQFGSLNSISEAAYPCLNELMLLLDSPQPYNLTSATMGAKYIDDEPASTLLVGSVFVDLFLDTFVRCYKIETLPALTLKNIMRSLVVVIYKHDFDSRPLKPLQAVLRRAVRRALDLLVVDLSYDIRQLVLTVTHAFIKRWPNLVGNLVVEAIEIAMDLLEKMDYLQHGDDILVDQTKNFVRTELALYAFSGVFHLLCKRPRTPEFFGIIKQVIGPHVLAEHNQYPHETLRDGLLRDTLTRAVEGDDESFQSIVNNLHTYVEVVHHTDYNLPLMQFVGLTLANLTRKTADLSLARFDPSPLLMLACLLIQHNKAHSRDLLMYLETLLRSSLVRFNVSVSSMRRVLQVTTTLYRRAAKASGTNADTTLVNPIAGAMFEITKDSLNLKARVLPATLAALVDALTANPAPESSPVNFVPLESQLQLAYDGVFYLYQESTLDGLMHSDFATSQSVAKMIIQGAEIQPSLLQNLSKNPMTVRVWNIFALAALSRPTGQAAALLFEHFMVFSLVYNTSLAPYHNSSWPGYDTPDGQDRAHADVSYAYAAIKLWLLLARKAASIRVMQDGEGLAAGIVWNELWPPFEIVLSTFEVDAQSGNASPLASSLWTAVGDLFLFVRQSRAVIALDTALPLRVLNGIKDIVRGESKVARIARSLKDPPPDDSLDYFVNQVLTELTAEEKLQAAKRQINMERSRRAVG